MELFTITKPVSSDLYHGTLTPVFQVQPKPMWFAHAAQEAKKYRPNVVKFKLSRPVRLLDITHQAFHHDFVARVNNHYAPQISNIKLEPLVALGLPDLTAQMNHLGGRIEQGVYPGPGNNSHERDLLGVIESFSPMFGNKHRFSEQCLHHTDKKMVEMMMTLYPDHDGYTCTNFWPSYHHGGFLMPETCLFRPTECIVQDTTCNGGCSSFRKSKKSTGQNSKNTNIYGGEHIEFWSYLRERGIDPESAIVYNKAVVDQGALFEDQ